MFKLIDFIQKHRDTWQHDLQEKPYCLSISNEGNFYLFKYSQIDSDFHNPVVRESRGIILWISGSDVIPACVPFSKFGNYGEDYADSIDWSTARVQEKVDGSIIKLWNWEGQWHVSTNGTINAFNAELPGGLIFKNFGELFMEAAQKAILIFDELDPRFTYIFELVSPYNRVVVPYEDVSIYHIGTRSNETGREFDMNIQVKIPAEYPLQTLEDCVEVAKTFPYSQEGFVVVDGDWNRVKIKSPAYVAAHHVVNNHVVTNARILNLVLTGEQQEFLTYFPEYEKSVSAVEKGLWNYVIWAEKMIAVAREKNFETKKDFALWISGDINAKHFSDLLFIWWDGKLKTSVREWVMGLAPEKILQKIGLD